MLDLLEAKARLDPPGPQGFKALRARRGPPEIRGLLAAPGPLALRVWPARQGRRAMLVLLGPLGRREILARRGPPERKGMLGRQDLLGPLLRLPDPPARRAILDLPARPEPRATLALWLARLGLRAVLEITGRPARRALR